MWWLSHSKYVCWWLQPSQLFLGSFTFFCILDVFIQMSYICLVNHTKYLWIKKHDGESQPSSQSKTVCTEWFFVWGLRKTKSLTMWNTYHFRWTARRAAETQYIQFHWTLSLQNTHFWYHEVIAHPADFHITQNLCLFLTESHARVH